MGPIRGEVALLFGHAAALPKGRAARAFDPARDIQKGNLVAILMDDQDAAEWARRFDIALVVGVTPIYYDCDYVHQEHCPKGCLAYLEGERPQLDGRWSKGATTGDVHSDNVLCEAWVEKYGERRGRLHAEYKKQIEAALERSEEL